MIETLWYGDSTAASMGRAVLRPASLVFGAVAGLRSVLYERGVLRVRKAPAPVVSVGALSVGGAGKTPFVLWLVERLRRSGLQPCVVTRGYFRAESGDSTFLLGPGCHAEGKELEDLVRGAGDEAVMMALRTGVPVAVGRDRAEACEEAMLAWSPDLFLLDDGFQHRALARDLDIVLVNGEEGRRALLPAGPLREGPRALARAGVVVTTGSDFPAWARPEGTLATHGRMRPSKLVAAVHEREGESPSALRGRRVVAVAAVARPGRFFGDLEDCGARVVSKVLRRDHHAWNAADLREIETAAAHADLVVTTEKDLVKLGGFAPGCGLLALRTEVDVDQEAALLERIEALASFDRSTHRTQYPPTSGGPFSS